MARSQEERYLLQATPGQSEYRFYNDAITLKDSDYGFGKTFQLDTFDPDMMNYPSLNSDYIISILCIIGPTAGVLSSEENQLSDSGFHGLILQRSRDDEAYSRIGYCKVSTDEFFDSKAMQTWQDSFEKRFITIV